MLQKTAVSDNILSLIRKLQKDTELQSFILTGGTALALQTGHRRSIDIDLFTRLEFDAGALLEYMEKHYNFRMNYQAASTLKGSVQDIQVDLITHNYQYVREPIEIGEVRMASPEDIAAMKVNAISGDGTRVKDFIDIYFLLKQFSFREIVGFFEEKYNSRNNAHAVKSLTWFDDVDLNNWPLMIREPELTFDQVKIEIIRQRDIFLSDEGIK